MTERVTGENFYEVSASVAKVFSSFSRRLKCLGLDDEEVATLLVQLAGAYAQRGGVSRERFEAVSRHLWEQVQVDMALGEFEASAVVTCGGTA